MSPGQVVYAHQFVNLTGENLTDASLFEEHLCCLLCDLTGLAIGKYNKVGGWPQTTSSYWCDALVLFFSVLFVSASTTAFHPISRTWMENTFNKNYVPKLKNRSC